jgi:Zn finger protein HypA/HybF involved in hydrogenase expression
MAQAQALSNAYWFKGSEIPHCPKCSSRMSKVSPMQGLSVLSERIVRCPKCHYITLSAKPVE